MDDFNKSFKSYLTISKELEDWLQQGRQRMDSLLKPEKNLLPEERVMYTMELQSDIEEQVKKYEQHQEMWQSLKPTTDAENSEESQVRMHVRTWTSYVRLINFARPAKQLQKRLASLRIACCLK